jgi:hypothetical protein
VGFYEHWDFCGSYKKTLPDHLKISYLITFFSTKPVTIAGIRIENRNENPE